MRAVEEPAIWTCAIDNVYAGLWSWPLLCGIWTTFVSRSRPWLRRRPVRQGREIDPGSGSAERAPARHRRSTGRATPPCELAAGPNLTRRTALRHRPTLDPADRRRPRAG